MRSLTIRACRAAAGFAALAVLAACAKEETPATPAPEDVAGAKDAAMMLGSRLKGRLVSAMQEGGPTAAVRVCSEEAPVIAADVSAETGYTVGRTALKVRNPKNVADAWETAQLQRFIAALEDGADPKTLETAEIVTDENGAKLRWAKAIILEEPCARCHGDSVDPGLLAEIRTVYPLDVATGFAVGEVRGMFTVEKTIR